MRRPAEPPEPTRAFATPWGRALLVVSAGQLLVCAFRVLSAATADLLGDHLADDAFYYFQIARNAPHLEATRGITTTGFHPLYEVGLVPVFRVFDDFDGVRASLILLVVGHICAGLMLFVYLRRHWSDGAAALVAGAWIASPALRAIVMYGLEAALVELTLVGLLLVCDVRRPPTTRRCAAVGAVLGASYLARNDAVVVTLPIVGAWAWSCRGRLAARGVLPLASGTGAALAVASPWLVHLAANDALFGTDAARALPLVPSVENPAAAGMRAVSGLPLALVSSTDSPTRAMGENVLLALIGLGMVAALVLRRRAWTLPEVALGLAVPVLHTLHVAVLGGIRAWYLVYGAVALFVVILPPLAAATVSRASRAPALARTTVRVVVAGIGAVGVVALLLVPPFRSFPQEAGKYRAALAAAPLIGADRVGSFNSGIFQFVLDPRDVVNLDGVVNREVQPHLRTHSLCRYLADQGITMLLDDTSRIDTALADGSGIAVLDRRVLSPALGYFGAIELVRIDTTSCR